MHLARCFNGGAPIPDSRINDAHWFRKIGKRKFCGKHCGVVESTDVDSSSSIYGYKDHMLNLALIIYKIKTGIYIS